MSRNLASFTKRLSPLGSNDASDDNTSVSPIDITQTNTLVASTLLGSVPEAQTHTIQLFLDIIHHPNFDRSSLTFRTPDDLFAYQTYGGLSRASYRSNVSPAERHFPNTIITQIIDHIEHERYTRPDTFVDHPGSQDEGDPVTSTLSNLSLVHSSWTWAAQKAIGRQLIIALPQFASETQRYSLVRRAATSPLFGGWTHSVDIHEDAISFDHSRERPSLAIAHILTTLFKRLSNIRFLSLPPIIAKFISASNMLAVCLKELTNIRCLTLRSVSADNVNGTEWIIEIIRIAKHLPMLTRLGLGRWGCRNSRMSEGQEELLRKRIQQIAVGQPPTNLKVISLRLSSETPREIVSWLFSYYNNAATTYLKKAHIFLDRGCGLLRHNHADNLAQGHSLFGDYVSAISPAQSLAHITELSLSLTRDGTIPEPVIASFLEASGSLRTLSISHGPNVDYSYIIRTLPPSVESLNYTLTLNHENFASFDDDFSRALTTHPSLSSIVLSITEEFKIVLAILHETNPRYLEWINPEEQKQAIMALPKPMLSRTREACMCTNVHLTYSYGRSGASLKYGKDDMRVHRPPNGPGIFVMPISPVTIQL